MVSLGTAFDDTAARRGASVALIYDQKAYSYAHLRARAAGIAGGLFARGIRPGDRVAIGLHNSSDLAAAIMGTLQAGAVLVPVNPACTAEELTYVLADAGARVAILEPEHAMSAAEASLPDLMLIATSLQGFEDAPPRPSVVGAEAPALITYTSGTTGRPKGAVLSHGALFANLTTVARAWRWSEDDRLLLTLPCFHLHGLGLGLLGSWLVGSSVVLRRRFVAEEALADLEGNRATMFFGVPTMYNRLLALPEERCGGYDLSRMRLWVSGSAPLPATTFERFKDRFGVELHDRYGMTECGFVLASAYGERRRAGTVGIPLPGISVRLVDPEAANCGRLDDVPDGMPGEIAIKGPNLFSGYWNRPEETARAFVGGYLRSGDIAQREPDGMFRIAGRMSVDILKTRGFKVSAVEIEDCLQRHPAVQEVAVVGVPDADQGERVVAVIMPVSGAEPGSDAIRVFAREHLAPHKVPSRVVFMTDIPRTGPGKFKKKEIVRLLLAENAET